MKHVPNGLWNRIPLSLMLRFPWLLGRAEYGDCVLGPPFAPPTMSKPDAIAAATRFCPLLSSHRFRMQYGSYHDWSTRRGATQTDGTPTWRTAPAFDAWKITVMHLSLPRPGGVSGGSSNRPRGFMTRLVIMIDDKAGQYYSALGI
jgi:hypothetical protein